MTQYVAYLDPQGDIDQQRAAIQAQVGLDAECLAEHIGGWRAAEADAYAFHVALVAPEGMDEPEAKAPRKQVTARKAKALEAYEKVRPRIREAKLLGITSLSGIARYLNETGTALPSGKPGEWKAAQAKRALEWLGEKS